ncbi:amino acid ABC transporter permease [Paraburkholderia sp. IMGN_8]|uniref:amino acid ABC transporter permease n=1 Tax=Paraburkholderia sp. IMGN_8 TaxID=3136564 RepID=UPI0031017438
MTYQFDFLSILDYGPVLAKGVALTVELIAVGGVAGLALAVACAWGKTQGPRSLRFAIDAYVELFRNTPFLIQLFFVFFGLPSFGIHISSNSAALLATMLNLGAYCTEILRAGIASVPKGQTEAALSLAMTRWQTFRHVILRPALRKVWPAISSQLVIVMLGSAVCSQISVEELSYAANFIQARNFRAFETYMATTLIYFGLAVALRAVLRVIGDRYVVARKVNPAVAAPIVMAPEGVSQ